MSSKNYELRVNQLDAIQLDHDIVSTLKQTLTKSLAQVAPTILAKYQPEIDLLLNTALWRCSVQKSGASFGQQMLFLKYNPDQLQSTKLALHYVLSILTRYCNDLLSHRFVDHELAQRFLQISERTLNLLHFVNLFRFLKTGRKPTVVDFLLGLNYVAAEDQKRNIGFYYMTRELFWEGLIELVGIAVPLINYHSLKRKFNRLLSTNGPRRDCREDVEVVRIQTTTLCASCEERPRIPSHFGCGHVFCHYCLTANVLADKDFECPKCQKWIGTRRIRVV